MTRAPSRPMERAWQAPDAPPVPPRWATRLSARPLVVYASDQVAAAKLFCAFFGTAVTEAAVDAVYKLPAAEGRLAVEDHRVTS